MANYQDVVNLLDSVPWLLNKDEEHEVIRAKLMQLVNIENQRNAHVEAYKSYLAALHNMEDAKRDFDESVRTASDHGFMDFYESTGKYNVVLTSYGQSKLFVIKAVRDFNRDGLKEVKDLVESVLLNSSGATIGHNMAFREAEALRDMLKLAGGDAYLTRVD